MTPAELRRKAAELRKKIEQLVQTAETENRELTEDEKATAADIRSQVEGFERRAKTQDELLAAPDPVRSETRSTAAIEIGDRVEAGEQAEDRSFGFGEWLVCVDTVCDRRSSYADAERSRERLENKYSSEFRKWDDPKRSKETRDLAANSGTSGGFLMPTQFYNQLMQVSAPMSIVRPRATVIPVGAETVEIPSLDQTTAQSAGSPPYFGGVVLTWSGESVSISSTEPGFRQTKLTLCELTGYTPVSRTLLQKSAISIEPMIYTLFGGAVAWAEDYNFLRGPGGGKPVGLLSAGNGARIQTSARGSASAISFANATTMWTKVLPESRGRGAWVGSIGAEEKILTMAGVSNAVFHPTGVYTANTDTINAGPSGVMLFMRPVLISTKLPALNSDGDFNFFDFSHYVIADGGPPEVASSDDYLFRTNQRAFRIVHKVGGAPWLNSYITLEDASTTVSPFVSLGVQ